MNPHPYTPARSIQEFIFYGNYFYGICAVAQSIEATLQQRYPLNATIYYVLIFMVTVLYYDYPYARRYAAHGGNTRTAWYMRHYRFIRWNQILISAILLIAFVMLVGAFIYSEFLVNAELENKDRIFMIQSKWKDPNMGYDFSAVVSKHLKTSSYPVSAVVGLIDQHLRILSSE